MYTYNQILSVLTHTQLQQIFQCNPGFDLRYLLQGSEKFIDSILNMMDTDPSFVLSGVHVQYYMYIHVHAYVLIYMYICVVYISLSHSTTTVRLE